MIFSFIFTYVHFSTSIFSLYLIKSRWLSFLLKPRLNRLNSIKRPVFKSPKTGRLIEVPLILHNSFNGTWVHGISGFRIYAWFNSKCCHSPRRHPFDLSSFFFFLFLGGLLPWPNPGTHWKRQFPTRFCTKWRKQENSINFCTTA